MSTFSSSSSRRTTKKTGFSEQDISKFLQRGATLASKGATAPEVPGQQTRTTVTTKSKAGGGAQLFGAKDEGTRVRESGFMGKFSGKSKEEIEAIARSFQQREQNIAQKRQQPGRSTLFMGRS